jgi:hypothetical protein
VLLLVVSFGVALTVESPAQVNFDLGFDGPTSLSGPTGSVAEAVYFCTLTQLAPEPGARGWSIILEAQNATITEISLIDTDAEALRRKEPCILGGSEFPGSFVTNQMGGGRACSAVILSFCTPLTLPVEGVSTIARIVVQATVPECGGSFGLNYVDASGCFAGVASTNVITRDSRSNTFANGLLSQSPLSVALISTDPCDPAVLIERLIGTLGGMDLEEGVKTALTALLESALNLLSDQTDQNDDQGASMIHAFIQAVSNLSPEVISGTDAATLLEAAGQILEALG